LTVTIAGERIAEGGTGLRRAKVRRVMEEGQWTERERWEVDTSARIFKRSPSDFPPMEPYRARLSSGMRNRAEETETHLSSLSSPLAWIEESPAEDWMPI
jgi:hypothetical protein